MVKYGRMPILFFLLLIAITAFSQDSLDTRFGFVGTGGMSFAAKYHLPYFTLEGNYSTGKGTTFSSVDPENDPKPGFKVIREVAKLNVRTDALGESNLQFQTKLSQFTKDLASWYITPSWGRGKKPTFPWYAPNAAALIQAESLQIVSTIRREKSSNPQVTGTVWEIGNEPNLFPAILPAEYAAIFSNYYRVIKREDPLAKVAMGSLFVPEVAQDLKARFAEDLEAKMKTELATAGLYNTLVALGVFSNLVNDVKNTVLSRALAQSSREYLNQIFQATSAKPDLITLHFYPYHDRAPFPDSANQALVIDTTVTGITNLMTSLSVNRQLDTAFAPTYSVNQKSRGAIWITEFGNIEQGISADSSAKKMKSLVHQFQSHSHIGAWLYYKSTGQDEQFALFSSGAAPLTRLALDPIFAPSTGDFKCDKLNIIGLTYWTLSHNLMDCSDSIVTTPPIDSVNIVTAPTMVKKIRAHSKGEGNAKPEMKNDREKSKNYFWYLPINADKGLARNVIGQIAK